MGRRVSRFGQIRIYVGKCMRLFKAEKQWKNFLSALIIVTLISMVTSSDMFVYYRDTQNGAFALVCACIWIGLFNSISSICREREIIKREHRAGVHISSYMLAHVIYELVICAVEALIVFGVTYFRNFSNLEDAKGLIGVFASDMFLIFLLIIFASDMLALLISSAVKTEQMAMTVMPFVLIIQLLLAGLVFQLSGTSQELSNYTISKWGLAAICALSRVNEMPSNLPYIPNDEHAATAANLYNILGYLFLFAIVFIILAIFVLKRVDKDER